MMEHFLKKIAEGRTDEHVHNEFVKFSKGIFENRYLIEGKKQKDKYSIKTSSEFANYFVRKCLEEIDGEEIEVKGIILATFALDLPFEVENIKKYMGIQQYVIRTKVNARDILDLMNLYPKVFFGLSFKTKDCELKIKEKAPKSGKPSNKGDDGPKADFCSIKTNNKEIIDELFFDCKDFEEIKINHTLHITGITLPANEKDPVKLRENAKRKGFLARMIKMDSKEIKKEYHFDA